LLPGQQAVQSMHAAIDFCFQHPEAAKEWQTNSNYLAVLSVANESELHKLVSKLEQREHVFTTFHEPDLNNELTAVAINYRDDLRKLTGGLPLMLK
jgi:peptidyl-tRNA hydrolase